MSISKSLNLYLLSFNCGRELINPDVFASHLFDALPTDSPSILPDLVVVNLQEISPIAYAFLGGSFVTPYLDRFRKAVDLALEQRLSSISDSNDNDEETKYINIRTETAGLTAIMIFVRSDMLSYVDDIMTANVGVGVQEMGNKGAAAVRLSWKLDDNNDDNDDDESNKTMHMAFVSAHLAPMEDQLERRNQDYKDIVRGLVFTSDRPKKSSPAESNTLTDEGEEDVPLLQGTPNNVSSKKSIGIYAPNTYLFFAGDLNYRTSSSPPSKSGSDESSFPTPPSTTPTNTSSTATTHFSALLSKDQLTPALKDNKTLHGLTEAAVTFPPTYKYKLPDSITSEVLTESDFSQFETYHFATHRWPSWCDRILFSPQLKPQSYTSLPLFKTSDHRPVALYLSVPLESVDNEGFVDRRPVEVDSEWRTRRTAARRKEIVVGVLSYLALTWEGRMLGVATLIAVVGAIWVAGNV